MSFAFHPRLGKELSNLLCIGAGNWNAPCGARAAIFVLQAFIDDSRKDGLFVLGGVIASAEAWTKFSAEWEQILPLAPLDSDLKRNFGFYDCLRAGDERIQNLPAFAKVIQDHVKCSLALTMRVADIAAAQRRIVAPGVMLSWGDYKNPYLYAFTSFIEIFHNQRQQFAAIIDPAEEVEIIFDDQSEKSIIRLAWDGFLKAQAPGAEVDRLGKEPPRFLDDRKFLPLQAADFIAGWVRYCTERGINPAKKAVKIGNVEIENRSMPMIRFELTQDHMAKFLLAMVRRNLPAGKTAIDTGTLLSRYLSPTT